MAELDGLIGALTAPDGRTATLGSALRPFQWSRPHESWGIWSALEGAQRQQLGQMVEFHVWLDLVFVIAYACLLWRLASRRTSRFFLVALLIAEAAEAVLLLTLASRLAAGGSALPPAGTTAVFIVTWGKWLAFLLFVAWLLAHREDFAARARMVAQALKTHRITAIFTLILAAVAIVPGGSILNQVPDLMRGWADEGVVWELRLLVGGIVLTLFFLSSLLVGRMRSAHVLVDEIRLAEAQPKPRPKPRLRAAWWPLALSIGVLGAMFLLSGIVLALGGHVPEVSQPVLWTVLGVSAFLTVTSLLLHRYRTRTVEPPVERTAQGGSAADLAFRVGDHLAVAAIALSGVSLVRAVLPPVVVSGTRPVLDGAVLAGTGESDRLLLTLAAVGAFCALAAWPVWHLWRHRTVPVPERAGKRSTDVQGASDGTAPFDGEFGARPALERRVLWIAAGLAVGVLAFASLAPVSVASIGAHPLFVVLLAAWMVVLGAVVVWFQDVQPIGIFRWMRLRRTPVIVLIAFVMLTSSVLGQGDQHLVRSAAAGNASNRPDLADAFAAWARDGVADECLTPDNARPLALIAAQGGGIRAAYWTSLVYQDLLADECSRSSIFLSSAVSGGAVGLSMSLNAWRDAAADESTVLPADAFSAGALATTAVADASRSDALAVGVAGALAGDVLASATGIRIPVGGATQWRDRAAQMEAVWVAGQPSLDGSFLEPENLMGSVDAASDGDAPDGGWAVLNSADARTGCRVLISQIEFPATSAGKEANSLPQCNESGDVAISIDLLGELPASCPLNPSWATAMTLAARFPVISPAGGVPDPRPCRRTDPDGAKSASTMQLIDGGYSDNSGLGTLADSAAPLARLIQEWNACIAAPGSNADRGPCAEDDARPIRPVVLYIRNEEGADIQTAPVDSIPEIMVPLYGMDANAMHGSEDAGLQRLRASLGALASADEPSTYIVAPRTYPSVVPPLGWYLSERSRAALKENLDRERGTEGQISERGHGSYSAFLDAVRAP